MATDPPRAHARHGSSIAGRDGGAGPAEAFHQGRDHPAHGDADDQRHLRAHADPQSDTAEKTRDREPGAHRPKSGRGRRGPGARPRNSGQEQQDTAQRAPLDQTAVVRHRGLEIGRQREQAGECKRNEEGRDRAESPRDEHRDRHQEEAPAARDRQPGSHVPPRGPAAGRIAGDPSRRPGRATSGTARRLLTSCPNGGFSSSTCRTRHSRRENINWVCSIQL